MRSNMTSGFTLIELLIVIAIIGILVTVAVPSYHVYTRRAHYTEIVQAVAPYKLGVEECFHIRGELAGCSAGKHGIPRAIPAGQGSGLINSLDVDNTGTITVIPLEKYGIKATDTYVLVPTISNGNIVWIPGGGGIENGYAN